MKAYFVNVIVFSVVFLFFISSVSCAISVDNLKEGIVKVITEDQIGTGFIVQKNGDSVHIVTAAHVIEAASEDDIKVEFYDRLKLPVNNVQTRDPEKVDLAVLVVQGEIPSGVRVFKLVPEQEGQEVTIIGFDLAENVPRAVRKGAITGKRDYDSAVVATMETKLDEGFSGSPMINQDGNVVGHVFSMSGEQTYGIPTDETQKFLKEFFGIGRTSKLPIIAGGVTLVGAGILGTVLASSNDDSGGSEEYLEANIINNKSTGWARIEIAYYDAEQETSVVVSDGDSAILRPLPYNNLEYDVTIYGSQDVVVDVEVKTHRVTKMFYNCTVSPENGYYGGIAKVQFPDGGMDDRGACSGEN